ncbi:MAG: hypothetical protein ACYDCM_07190 [Candidatus Acidiferrales bacterium]
MASSSYIDLADGSVFVAAEFPSEFHFKKYSQHPRVVHLPHPMSGQTVGAEIATRLTEIGVIETDSVFAVSHKAGLRHKGMKL